MGKRKRRKRERATIPTDLRELLHSIRGESERGCVLGMSTLIDSMLELALRERFKRDSGVTDDFLDSLFTRDPSPLLGSSYAVAMIARAMGLITEKTKASLDALRLLRNDAAHLTHGFEIDDDAMDDIEACLTEKERKWAAYCVRRQHRKGRNKVIDRFSITTLCVLSRVVAPIVTPNITVEKLDEGGILAEILSLEGYANL